MTSDQERDFEHQWPALAVRVNRLLRRKRISAWLAEDLTQETGLRLVRMWPKIDQTQPLWPLAATIALNLMRDEMRREASHELTYDVPDGPSKENVEQRGMARLELRAVGGALAQMTEPHRHALLDEVSSARTVSPEPTAVRMLRMRARRKLQNILDHASLLGIAFADQLRRVMRETEVAISKMLPSHVENASAAAISLLAALSLGIALVPDTPGEAGETPAGSRPHAVSDNEASTAGAGNGAARRDSRDASRSRAGSRMANGRSKITDRGGRDRDSRGGSDDEKPPFPGSVNYGIHLTEDTYISGTMQAEVVLGEDAWQRDADPPEGTGSVNCTVAPASSGASCSHSGEGWSERRVRTSHDGEAVVAGRRVY